MNPSKIKAVCWMGLCLVSGAISGAHAGVDPSYVKVKVYEMRVSPNTDCTSAITVFSNSAPTLQDFANAPTLGSGAIPNGTYNCIMLKMNDNIHFTPASATGSHGACVVGTDYATDVGHDETAVDPDGTRHTMGPVGTEDTIWLYIRQGGSTGGGGGAFDPATGLSLTTPLVVSGDTSHTMIFDFSGAVGEEFNGSSWECGCQAPTMGFR